MTAIQKERFNPSQRSESVRPSTPSMDYYIFPPVITSEIYRNRNGQPMDPGDVFSIVRGFEVFGFPKNVYASLIPEIAERAHRSGANLKDDRSLGMVMAGFTISRDIKIPRRAFLFGGVIAVGATAIYLSPIGSRLRRRYADCAVVLPDDTSEKLMPLDRDEYNKMDIYKKADFLLRGGYIKDWKITDREIFFQQAAAEGRKVLVEAMAPILEENQVGLNERTKIAYNKDGFSNFLKEKKTYTDADIDDRYKKSWGISITDNKSGNSIGITNLGRMIESLQSQFENGEYTECVMQVMNAVLHEMNHLPGARKKFTVDETKMLEDWLRKIFVTKDIFLEEQGQLFFEIFFKKNNISSSILSESARNDDGGAFGEVFREFTQRESRNQLDAKIAGRKNKTPYYSPFDEYAGYQILTYFNEKLGVRDAELMSFLNGVRSGNGDAKTVIDLIRFYEKKAHDMGMTKVEPANILLALNKIEVGARKLKERGDKFSEEVSQQNDSQVFVNYVCDLNDRVVEYREMIDIALSKEFTTSDKSRVVDAAKPLIPESTLALPVAI